MAKGSIRIRGGRVLRKGELRDEELLVREGKIVAAIPQVDQLIEANGLIVAPGYIDLQVNGAYGRDFTHDSDALETVAKMLPRHGVTSFLPTIVSSTPEEYRQILKYLNWPFGIHLEGPFLNPKYAGAHAVEKLQKAGKYENLENVKMVTLAPEVAGAMIPQLLEKGIIVSAGHSDATYEQLINSGVSCITHLFNAMRPFQQREPGIIGAALAKPGLPYSIIADGLHLHPAVVKMAWQANPDGLFLVSDCMAGLGLAPGTYYLGKRAVTVTSNGAYIDDTLAGSIVGLDQAVRNLYAWTSCTIPQALEAASLKPAKLLGLAGKKGSLDVGADADFLLLDEGLNVQATYGMGVPLFQKQNT